MLITAGSKGVNNVLLLYYIMSVPFFCSYHIWCCLRSTTDQTHSNMESIISPLKPKSDQHLVSPYNNTTE